MAKVSTIDPNPADQALTEAALKAELETHLATEELPNRKNGSTSKTIKSLSGSFELQAPRDHAGTFEPQRVKKHQTHLTDEIEHKVIALFALGTNYRGCSKPGWPFSTNSLNPGLTPIIRNGASTSPMVFINTPREYSSW